MGPYMHGQCPTFKRSFSDFKAEYSSWAICISLATLIFSPFNTRLSISHISNLQRVNVKGGTCVSASMGREQLHCRALWATTVLL